MWSSESIIVFPFLCRSTNYLKETLLFHVWEASNFIYFPMNTQLSKALIEKDVFSPLLYISIREESSHICCNKWYTWFYSLHFTLCSLHKFFFLFIKNKFSLVLLNIPNSESSSYCIGCNLDRLRMFQIMKSLFLFCLTVLPSISLPSLILLSNKKEPGHAINPLLGKVPG